MTLVAFEPHFVHNCLCFLDQFKELDHQMVFLESLLNQISTFWTCTCL
jgi:hypothetical protein